MNTPGLIKRAKEERRKQAAGEVDVLHCKPPNGNLEDQVMRDILVPGLQDSFTCVVMPEHRRADLGILIEDLYIQIQLKTNGPYKTNGTLKPDNCRSKNGGGRAIFTDCSGYENMLITFIKLRIVDGVLKVYMWFTEGDVNDAMRENADGTLGPQRLPRRTMQDLIKAIHKSTLPKVTLRHMLMDVPGPNHFKEVCTIEALRMVYVVNVQKETSKHLTVF
jgi:hypothetical protein